MLIFLFRKTFSKFYRQHYDNVSKFNVGLKTLLHQGLSEPEFYGDLVYKFKKIVGRADFSDQFRKNIVRYKRIGYNINIMRQSACLVFNPITVNNFASLSIEERGGSVVECRTPEREIGGSKPITAVLCP